MDSKVLTMDQIGQNVKDTEYAIRGPIVQKADELVERLNKGEKKPFKKLLYTNIGNPLSLGQPSYTFNREVLSVCLTPALMDSPNISKDAKERAKKIISCVEYPSALGAYTSGPGLTMVRESIKKFIEERDGYPSNINNIFCSNGASDAIMTIISVLLSTPNSGIMVPIPQYPLYTALIAFYNGVPVPYYLDESHGWELDMKDLEVNYVKAKSEGVNVKAIVVINPGNPTGQVMTKENLQDIVKFCHTHKLVICADEVYQKNIYGDKPFISFKKIIHDLGAPYNKHELISFHSTSKGLIGECGLRGGYMELENIDPNVHAQITKLRTILSLCPNIVGQIIVILFYNIIID